MEARTLQLLLLPAVQGAGSQVKGLLLGLVRDSCAAVTAGMTEKATALGEQPTELQPFMQLQARVWFSCLCANCVHKLHACP